MANNINQYTFAGGQNNQVSPLFMGNNECELVQNYHLDNLGSLTKRNGIVYLIGQVINDQPILNMFYFKDSQGTDYSNILIATNEGASQTIYKTLTDAWVYSKTGDTANSIPTFCTFIDYVFRTNGAEAMASSQDVATWGTDNCLATIKPFYCCVWEDRIYAGNDNSTVAPSRIYWSSLPTGTPLAVTWTSGSDYADINPDDNDYITWLEPFGDQLVIFKTQAMYRWIFGQTEPDKIIDVGTPQGLTVKSNQGFLFFLGYHNSQYGVWTYTKGNRPQCISRKIQPFIDAIPTPTNCRAEVDDNHYYLYVGDLTVDGESYSNAMLVYTISLNTWHIETYPFEIKAMARFQRKTIAATDIYDAIYLGDDDGYVYRKGTGNCDYLGTTAKPINGRIVTKEYPIPGFPIESDLSYIYVLARNALGSKVNYRLDRRDWKGWRDLQERITEGNLLGKGRTCQLSITDNSINTSKIEGFTIEVKDWEKKKK